MKVPSISELVVRTPSGDPWPAFNIHLVYDDDEPDLIVAFVTPPPPEGSAVYRANRKVAHGVELEVEMKVCEVST